MTPIITDISKPDFFLFKPFKVYPAFYKDDKTYIWDGEFVDITETEDEYGDLDGFRLQDMTHCKPGDMLVSTHKNVLVYHNYDENLLYPHAVIHLSPRVFSSSGSRVDSGHVFENNRKFFDEDIRYHIPIEYVFALEGISVERKFNTVIYRFPTKEQLLTTLKDSWLDNSRIKILT